VQISSFTLKLEGKFWVKYSLMHIYNNIKLRHAKLLIGFQYEVIACLLAVVFKFANILHSLLSLDTSIGLTEEEGYLTYQIIVSMKTGSAAGIAK
jgi:hypothetical protein